MSTYKHGDRVTLKDDSTIHRYVGPNPFWSTYSIIVRCRDLSLSSVPTTDLNSYDRPKATKKPSFKGGDKVLHKTIGECTYLGEVIWEDQCIVSIYPAKTSEGLPYRRVYLRDLSPAPAKPEPKKPEPKFKVRDRVAIHRHGGINNGVVEVTHPHIAGFFAYTVRRDDDGARTRCSEVTLALIPSPEKAKAVAGGLQEHSVGANYPYIPVAFVTGDKISWRLMNAQTGKYAGYKDLFCGKWWPYAYVTVHEALALADQRTHPSTAIVWGE